MTKSPLTVVRVAVFCLPLTLVASCGMESGGYTAPPAHTGAVITVSPELVEWEVGGPGCTTTDMQDTYFDIVVKSASGATQNGVGLAISLALAPGTFTPPPQVMYLYDDLDDDGLYTDLITVFPHYVQTGPSGSKMVMVRYDLGGCEYGGNLDVFSGSSYGSANITVDVP